MPTFRVRHFLQLHALVLLVLALAACAHRPAGESSRRCVPDKVDPSYARFGTVYTACEVDRPARALPPPPPNAVERVEVMSASTARQTLGTRCASAEVELVVDEEGRVIAESARVIRSTDVAYGESVLRTISAQRFTPAMKDSLPVRQVTRLGRGAGARVVVRSSGVPPTTSRPPRC